jgi:hypothetical protein
MRQCRCDLWIFQVLFQAVIISLARTALKSAFFRRDSSDNCEEPFHRFCVSQALLSGCECWGPSFYNRTGIELLHVPRVCSYRYTSSYAPIDTVPGYCHSSTYDTPLVGAPILYKGRTNNTGTLP